MGPSSIAHRPAHNHPSPSTPMRTTPCLPAIHSVCTCHAHPRPSQTIGFAPPTPLALTAPQQHRDRARLFHHLAPPPRCYGATPHVMHPFTDIPRHRACLREPARDYMGRQRKARRREAVDGTKSDRGQVCKRRGQFLRYLHGRGGCWMLVTLMVERVREVCGLFVSYNERLDYSTIVAGRVCSLWMQSMISCEEYISLWPLVCRLDLEIRGMGECKSNLGAWVVWMMRSIFKLSTHDLGLKITHSESLFVELGGHLCRFRARYCGSTDIQHPRRPTQILPLLSPQSLAPPEG